MSGFKPKSSSSSCFHWMYERLFLKSSSTCPFCSSVQLVTLPHVIPQFTRPSFTAHPCCTAEPSSFSGSSTISTPEGLLFLPLSWQRKAKLTLWHLPKLFLVVQQNLSFLTSSISSSTRFMSQLPSAAQAWLGDFGSGLRTSILACIL